MAPSALPNHTRNPWAWLPPAAILMALAWMPGLVSASSARFFLYAGLLPAITWWSWWRAPCKLPHLLMPLALLVLLAISYLPHVSYLREGLHATLTLWAFTWAAAAAFAYTRTAPDHARACIAEATAICGSLIALPTLLPQVDSGGTLANPTLLGTLCALTALWTIARLLVLAPPLTPARRLLLACALALQGYAAFATQALLPLAMLILGATPLLLIHWRNAAPAHRRRLTFGALPLLIIATTFLAYSQATPISDHLHSRHFMARLTSRAIAEAPLLGHGPGTFPRIWAEQQALHFVNDANLHHRPYWTHAHHAHNLALHLWAELGLLAPILFFLPFIGLMRHPRANPCWAIALATLPALAFSVPLEEPITAFLIAITLGSGLATAKSDKRPAPPPASRRPLQLIPLPLLLLALLLSASHLVGDRLLAYGVDHTSPSALAAAERFSLHPAHAMRHRAAILRVVQSEAAHPLAQAAAQRDPSPAAYLAWGVAAASAHREDIAVRAFHQALRLQPWFFSAHFNLALIHEAMGQRELAQRHATRARSLRPTDPRLQRLPY